jgi:hypothetical protein
MTKRKYEFPVSHCIVCPSADLTEEHPWAKWLQPHLIKMTSFSHATVTVTEERKVQASRRVRVGDLQKRGLIVACARCNNGWMSDLQQKAKPHLLPLMHGDVSAIGINEQKLLTAWIAMTISVAEYFGGRIAVPSADRRYIKKFRAAPPHWKIWIGNFARGDWRPHLVHNTFAFSSEKYHIKRNEFGMRQPQAQTSAFTVNKLDIFAGSSISDIFEKWRLTARGSRKLAQIWPIERNIVSWPPDALSDTEADQIAHSFVHFTDTIRAA